MNPECKICDKFKIHNVLIEKNRFDFDVYVLLARPRNTIVTINRYNFFSVSLKTNLQTVKEKPLQKVYYEQISHVIKILHKKNHVIKILPENRTSIYQNLHFNVGRVAEKSIKKKRETEAIGGFQVIDIIHPFRKNL